MFKWKGWVKYQTSGFLSKKLKMLKFIDRKKVLRDIQWNFQLQRAKKNWKNFYHANIEIGYP